MTKRRSGSSKFINTGEPGICAACESQFTRFWNDEQGEFCWECRRSLGLHSNALAAVALDLIDSAPPSQREAVVADLMRDAAKMSPSERRLRLGPAEPAAPPVNQAAVLAAVRSMTTYHLDAPLPVETLPTPTSYALASNGLFEIHETDIARIIVEAPKVILGLTEPLSAGMTLHLPRIPYAMLASTVAFFRAVCVEKKGSSEAIVRIWWRRGGACEPCGGTGALSGGTCGVCGGAGTRAGSYEIRVPDGGQRVSGAGVHHQDTFDATPSGDLIHVADIHSHGSSMGAFWSGTDDGDELKAPEGRMFGVIGKVAQPLPEWRWRMRTRGPAAQTGFIDLDVSDLFDMPAADTVPFTATWKAIFQAARDVSNIKDGLVRLFCPVDPFHDATFPPAWLESVTEQTYGHGGHGMYGSFHGDWRVLGNNRSTHAPAAVQSGFIYISNAAGRLEEFEVDGAKLTATGKFLDLTDTKA